MGVPRMPAAINTKADIGARQCSGDRVLQCQPSANTEHAASVWRRAKRQHVAFSDSALRRRHSLGQIMYDDLHQARPRSLDFGCECDRRV